MELFMCNIGAMNCRNYKEFVYFLKKEWICFSRIYKAPPRCPHGPLKSVYSGPSKVSKGAPQKCL